MTGYLRFLLAYLVLLSHVGPGVVHGFNLGVFAVVIFYILAGHVITHLLENIFSARPLWVYYIERGLRIYPLYLFACFCTIIFLLLTHFGIPRFTPLNLFFNLFVIPLNYYMWLQKYEVVLTGLNPPFGWWLVPPAWTLGLELQVYLIFPFLIRYQLLKVVCFLLSLFIFTLSNLKILNTDYWGYRLLPGVLFIFLLGSILQRLKDGRALFKERFLLIFSYSVSLLSFIYLVLFRSFSQPYIRETLLGIIIGVPLTYFCLHFSKKLPFNRLAGFLSYAVYVFHFLSIWILKWTSLHLSPIFLTLSVTFLTFTFSFLGVFLVEKPIEKLRFNL